jgi:hypothetical protein
MQCKPIALYQLPDDIDALKSLIMERLLAVSNFRQTSKRLLIKNEQLQARVLGHIIRSKR